LAFYDIARSKSEYDYYLVLRGTFASTAAGVWSTRPLKTTTGPVEDRMEIDGVRSALPETAGGEPERVTVTVRLHNHDDALTPYIRGTASAAASTENKGDSFTNYTGKLYLGVRDPADGSLYEQAITPTMCLAGSMSYDGFTVTLPMASFDDRVLGQSQIAFTVRDLKASTAGADPGDWVGRYDSGTLTQAEFSASLGGYTENLDETIPYLYGKQIVPLLRVGESIASDRNLYGAWTFVAFASIKEPSTTGFSASSSGVVNGWPIYVENRGEILKEMPEHHNVRDFSPQVMIERIQRSVTNAQGETFDVWVLIVKFTTGTDDQHKKLMASKLFIDPKPSHQGIATDAEVLAGLSYSPGPGLIAALVRDHSVAGSSGVDSTSFARVRGGAGLGIVYRPTDPIRTAIHRVANAGGYSPWIGVDDALHISAAGSYNSADETTIAAGLQHVTHADIIDGWSEELPYNSGQLGAPARRVVLAWSDEQRRFWSNDKDGRHLLVEAPGVLATVPDISEAIDAEIDGAAIYPPKALSLLTAITIRRGLPRRRIHAVCRAWLATIEKGTLLYLSHPRGLGDNSGGGYALRLVRLESTDYQPGEDGCACVFEDLGPVADLKVGVLDTITNWTATGPTAGDQITLTSGSRTVTCNTGNVRQFSAADVGRLLWTPGAVNDGNRSSKRIATFTSATSVDVDAVDAAYSATETITASGSNYSATWIIMESQETKTSSYRPTRIRVCVEATGVFRDGSTEGYVYTIA
jgi:hypothetical protein